MKVANKHHMECTISKVPLMVNTNFKPKTPLTWNGKIIQ